MIWGICLIVFALGMVVAALRERNLARRQFAWVQVPGTVMRSGVTMGSGFQPDIEYQYIFDNRVQRSTQVATNTIALAWRGPAARLAEKYPKGSAVNVFVDPAKPENAVLEPGGDYHFLPFIFCIAGIALYAGARIVFGS
jgi:hypothetical protein